MCSEPQVYCLRLQPGGNYLSPESPEFGKSATLLFLGSQFIIEKEERKMKYQFLTETSLDYVFSLYSELLRDVLLEKQFCS